MVIGFSFPRWTNQRRESANLCRGETSRGTSRTRLRARRALRHSQVTMFATALTSKLAAPTALKASVRARHESTASPAPAPRVSETPHRSIGRWIGSMRQNPPRVVSAALAAEDARSAGTDPVSSTGRSTSSPSDGVDPTGPSGRPSALRRPERVDFLSASLSELGDAHNLPMEG